MNFWKKVRDWNAKYKTESRERVANSNSQSNTNTKREIPKEIIKEPEIATVNNRLEKSNKASDYKKEFLKTFKSLTYSHHSWSIWNDFVTMLACSISNSVDKTHYNEREKLYLSIIEKYNEEEQILFPELAAHLVMALEENPEQDFLGTIFMDLGLGNKRNGQFFTPYHISQFMAKAVTHDFEAEIKEHGYISVHDPCCGSGVMLIAEINEVKNQLKDSELNFQNHLLVVGQDIDFTAAMMCYIQISLLGVAGYVKVGDALSKPITDGDSTDNYWFTPMYFSKIWHMRRIFHSIDELTKGGEEKCQ